MPFPWTSAATLATLLVAACGGGSGGSGDPGDAASVTYTADTTSIVANPERGFYHHAGTTPAAFAPLSKSELEGFRTGEGVTLILRFWYLTGFEKTAISDAYLDDIQGDLDTIRQAGMKAIVRFAYTEQGDANAPDAGKAQVLSHIAQLRPILEANRDVIALVHAGFVGAWGEWYYSKSFGTGGAGELAAGYPQGLTDRRAVLDALLDAVPSRTVALRTPAFKQAFYGAAPLGSADAFRGSDAARVGHHDDCFVASDTDYGTYADVAADKAYLAQENLWVPQGGETCAKSAYSGWTNAAADMRALHFSYLNADYNKEVLSTWGSHIDEARRSLGYRLALVEGTFSKMAASGGAMTVRFTVRNDGWAPPYNPRGLRVVLRDTSMSAVHSFALQSDPRRWTPGAATTVDERVTLTGVPAGTYDLLLHLPDPEASLVARPEYAIRLANTGLWEADTGFNRLNHQVTVTAP